VTQVDDAFSGEDRDVAGPPVSRPEPPERPHEPAVDAAAELARLSALPLDERAGALAGTVQRLEEELDATEATPAGN
jgi:uncharacterized small protein (DUF1192 family)